MTKAAEVVSNIFSLLCVITFIVLLYFFHKTAPLLFAHYQGKDGPESIFESRNVAKIFYAEAKKNNPRTLELMREISGIFESLHATSTDDEINYAFEAQQKALRDYVEDEKLQNSPEPIAIMLRHSLAFPAKDDFFEQVKNGSVEKATSTPPAPIR